VRVGILDTETTGLDPVTGAILEFGMLVLDVDLDTWAWSEIDRFEALNDPGFPIPPDATRVNGITNAMVAGHRLDLGKVAGLIAGCELVIAHNAHFDKGFVSAICPPALEAKWVCSCNGIKWDQKVGRSLKALSAFHQVTNPAPHRAMGDVLTLLGVLGKKDEVGRTYLEVLLRTSLPGSARGMDAFTAAS